MKITIVVPSYEQGEYLEKCLDSLKAQSISELEVLVYDADSKDDTSNILRKFSSFCDINIEKDLGQAHAINKGLRRCSGDIIGFLNSDDTLLPGCLQRVIDYWRINPETDLLYGNAKYIDRDGEIIGDYRTSEWNWEKFQGECFICQPAAFWSRRIMGNIGFLDQSLQCSLDYDYWLRIALARGTVGKVDEFLACSRDYPETKTRSLRNRVFVENIMLSLKRLGFVHASWFSQYMDYFKYEEKLFWTAILPPAGRTRDLITKLMQCVSRVWARDVYIKNSPCHRII